MMVLRRALNLILPVGLGVELGRFPGGGDVHLRPDAE